MLKRSKLSTISIYFLSKFPALFHFRASEKKKYPSQGDARTQQDKVD
jgi:hypothetical protein